MIVPVLLVQILFYLSTRSSNSVAESRMTTVRVGGGDQMALLAGAPSNCNENPHLKNISIVLIAFGKARDTDMVERAYESIRGAGKFAGPIVVINNAPEGRYEQGDDPNLFIYRDETLATQKFRSDTDLKMTYKRFKTQILDIIDTIPALEHVETAVYMDIDILVGRDFSSFATYIAEAQHSIVSDPNFINRPYSFMQMFPERRENEDYHGGVFVLHRQHSRHCLKLWQELFDTHAYDRDQIPLTLVNRDPNNNCEIRAMDQVTFILFPMKKDMVSGFAKTFVHVTNTKRAKTIPPDVQEVYFLKTIGVQHTAVGTF